MPDYELPVPNSTDPADISHLAPNPGHQGAVWLQSGNTWTEIVTADNYIRNIISCELRFPTPTARLVATGGTDPDHPGWDGWARLVRTPATKNWWFPTGLVPHVTKVCERLGYQVRHIEGRARPLEGIPEHTAEPIVDRDYQLLAADRGYDLGRGIMDMPPRSGKTRTAMELIRRLGLPAVWTAPTDRIAQQTLSVARGFFGDHFAVHLIGSKPDAVKSAGFMRLVIATEATAAALPESFYATREVIMVDEWHHGASTRYSKDIFPKCDHIYYRYGMTGTHFRSGDDSLAMHGLISDVIIKVPAGELVRRGYLVPTHAVFLPMPSNPKLRGLGGHMFNKHHGKHGIHEHKGRNQLVAHAAMQALSVGRKPLILVGTKKQGYMIKSILDNFMPVTGSGYQFDSVEFVSTDKPRPRQGDIINSYLNNEEVQILIGTSLLGEGVDLPSADCLIYARGEKAEVSLVQNIYRVVTADGTKKNAVVIDFADRHNSRLLKHSHQRLDIYHREDTFSVTVLQDVNHLATWLQHAAVADS